jgi:hypothetical protein
MRYYLKVIHDRRNFNMPIPNTNKQDKVHCDTKIQTRLAVAFVQKVETVSVRNDVSANQSNQLKQTIDGFIGLLAGKTSKIATIEEINVALKN